MLQRILFAEILGRTRGTRITSKKQWKRHVASVEIDYEEYAGVNEIYRALNKIKEPLRSCLILKQQGLSYKEIAGSLELNESSIGTFVARARQEFTRFYGKIGKDTI